MQPLKVVNNGTKPSDEGVESSPVEDALAKHVRRCFSDAEKARRDNGIEEHMLRCLRAKKCEYDPADKDLVGANDIYIGIASLKARAAESWINDILLNSLDVPWTLDHSPIPELSKKQREAVLDELERAYYKFGGFTPALKIAAQKLKYDAVLKQNNIAEKACDNMTKLVSDQLIEGGWRSSFAEFVSDLTVFPNAFLRAPVYVTMPRTTWDGENLKVEVKQIPTVRRKSALDVYPSRDSTNTQNGEYIIVRDRYTPDQLYSCIGMPGFSEAAIRKILADVADTGYEETMSGDAERKRLEERRDTLMQQGTIDTLVLNGRVRGELLKKNNVLVSDEQAYYEVEIWTVRDTTIRAVLNPYPTGARPLYTTSFVKVPGSFWGQGTISLVLDCQRMCNAAARSITRNMAYSAGPIGEADFDRFADGERITEVEPYRIYPVTPDMGGGGQRALNFQTVPCNVSMLQSIFDQYSKIADDLSGVPSYVLGQPQVAGAGRTLGGLSMLMGNAAKGIKNSLLNVDRDVIEPCVGFFVTVNMLTSKDPGIKADAQVIARGASGLLQRELAQTRTVEILQLLTPYVQAGAVSPDGLKILLREVLKPTGMPIDRIIPDPDEGSQYGALAGLLQPGNLQQGMQRGSSTAPALPPQSQPGPAEPPHPVPVNMSTGA